ncbi:MAG: hypothetical protein M3065_01315 [Actinomycetota bacterium]|nr:hypothetical protein [Actinomycetota bacterium]
MIVKYVAQSARDRHGLFNEWAALQFLSQLELHPAVSPTFYGGDLQAGVLVLEDLGAAEGLADLLLGSDAARAQATLISFARTLGRMQATSIPRLSEYRRLRAQLGPPRGASIIEAPALAAAFEHAVGSAGLSLGGAADDVEAVIGGVSRPGRFLALVHGDACPSNERLVDHRVVLVDFATAGPRHGLLDGVCGRVPFPSCWCARRLPEHIAPLMEQAYRSELVRGCPAAGDDAAFATAALTAAAYWMVETTTLALSTMPFRDFQWGISTIGQRLAHRVSLFAKISEQAGSYQALAALLARLVAVLGLAEEQLPLYPVFGGPTMPAHPVTP